MAQKGKFLWGIGSVIILSIGVALMFFLQKPQDLAFCSAALSTNEWTTKPVVASVDVCRDEKGQPCDVASFTTQTLTENGATAVLTARTMKGDLVTCDASLPAKIDTVPPTCDTILDPAGWTAISEVKAFTGETPQGDDQTVVVLAVDA